MSDNDSYQELPLKSFAAMIYEDEIERLTSGPGGIMEMKQTIADKEAKIERLTKIIKHLDAMNIPGTYFIHAELGNKDHNGMPEKLLVVPSYGCDFSYVYQRTDRTTGPEW